MKVLATVGAILSEPVRLWVALICVVAQAIVFGLVIYAAAWLADTIGF